MWPGTETSIATETGPAGKPEKPAHLQGKIMERLRDQDEDWGLTRIAYAAQDRRMMRDRARLRIAHQPSRAIALIDLLDDAPIALHRSESGLIAYQVQREGVVITLPWVSIMGDGLTQ